MDISNKSLVKMSSKGQIVVPQNIRAYLRLEAGSVFECFNADSMIVFMKLPVQMTREDIETIARIKQAWKQVEEGKFKQLSKSEALKRLKQGKL
jgi:bifunctional DNA-binding transcriptional regulator/antitoxin component of YhaV-PrlF toxin-antitoxin module